MTLTETDYDILAAISSGRVEPGTSVSHFVDYCDNEIGGNPTPLIENGYIAANPAGTLVAGLTDKGKAALAAHVSKA